MKGIDAFVKILSQGRGKDKKFKSLEVREANSSHLKRFLHSDTKEILLILKYVDNNVVVFISLVYYTRVNR